MDAIKDLDDEDIDDLVQQMKGMPRKYQSDVLLAAKLLLQKETELSLEILGKCRRDLGTGGFDLKEDDEFGYEYKPYDSSPENSPAHQKKIEAIQSGSTNAYQQRAQQNKISYARPISAKSTNNGSTGARPSTARKVALNSADSKKKAPSVLNAKQATENQEEENVDDRLASLATGATVELDEQKSQLMKSMNKQDTKLANERERQRSALKQRMDREREKKQEQQAGKALDILDGAKTNEETRQQQREKQESEIKTQLQTRRARSAKSETRPDEDQSAEAAAAAATGDESSAKKEKAKKKKKRSKTFAAEGSGDVPVDVPADEPAGRERTKSAANSVVVDIDNS